MYKVIIAGSRSIKTYALIREAIVLSGLWKDYGKDIIVISGEAEGADKLGEEFAERNGLKVLKRPAKWSNIKAKGAVVKTRYNGEKYNALAGHWRNAEMAEEGDCALVIWDGKSTGSLNMVEQMLKLEKRVILFPLNISVDLYDSLIAKGVEIILPDE
jgi:hypothetical protein